MSSARSLEAMLDAAQQGLEPRRAWSHPTGVSQRVTLPPLPTGRHMLARMPIRQEPEAGEWEATAFDSVTPWVCEFRDALVHGSAGIIAVDEIIVADTLARTAGVPGIDLVVSSEVAQLQGCWLSLLYANSANYYHWTIDCLGRLAAADAETLAQCTQILTPPLETEFQTAGFALTGLPRSHCVREMPVDATVRVERLLVPWTVTADLFPHPCVRDYYLRFPRTEPGPSPRRFYIERRSSPNRRLANEDEVIMALERMGFACVRLEAMLLAEQIALFANADIIVAPHGAGLANLVYARAGCGLIELHMDSYVNWCFRRLAAVCQVSYDCVIGRQLPATGAGTVHAQEWAVSVTHMLGAVEQMIASRG